jgi:hypothetical protein
MKNRFDIIQYLIDSNNFKSYLEIGVRYAAEIDGISLMTIKCNKKVGVDIQNPAATYIMSSDKYFQSFNQTFDIIFIDGDHEKNQVHRDILNSLNCLNDGGIIVCHDINPPSERMLHPGKCHNAWETWALLRQTRSDLQMHALDVDMIGVICKGSQTLYLDDIQYTWNYMDMHRIELLNVIDIDTFKQIYTKK